MLLRTASRGDQMRRDKLPAWPRTDPLRGMLLWLGTSRSTCLHPHPDAISFSSPLLPIRWSPGVVPSHLVSQESPCFSDVCATSLFYGHTVVRMPAQGRAPQSTLEKVFRLSVKCLQAPRLLFSPRAENFLTHRGPLSERGRASVSSFRGSRALCLSPNPCSYESN